MPKVTKATKALLMVSAICMVSGLILGSIGAAFGGAKLIYLNRQDGIHVLNHSPLQLEELFFQFDTEQIDSLALHADGCAVRIITGNTFGVSYRYDPFFWEYSLSEEANRASVSLQPKPSIGFGVFQPLFNIRQTEIVLTVPPDKTLRQVSVVSNAVSIEIDGISTDLISFDVNAGYMEIRQVSCHQMDVSANACSVRVSNVSTSESAQINTNAGEIRFEQASLKNMSLSMNAGSINYNGTLRGNNQIVLAAGSLNLRLSQPESDFSFFTSVNAGSLSINNVDFSGFRSNHRSGSGETDLDIQVDFGNADIHTLH
jgi:hypothetical protein